MHRRCVALLILSACYTSIADDAHDDGIASAPADDATTNDSPSGTTSSGASTASSNASTSAGDAEAGEGDDGVGTQGDDSGSAETDATTDSGVDDPPPPVVCIDEPTVDGQATWYELATPLVNCSYETNTLPQYYGALNTAQYADAAACGACARVTGPDGTIDVQIVDQCPIDTNPICYEGHIDLSPPAFDAIGNPVDGIIPISWHWVPCDVVGPIQYLFKDGSNAFWTAVQIRNHRYAIASVEHRGDDDAWHALARTDYNYFVAEDGMGPGPYELRVTDVYGHQVTDDGIALLIATPIEGAAQLDACD